MSKLLKFIVGGAPYLLYEHLKTNKEINENISSSISKDEIEHINELICNAKQQGLKEFNIDISRDLHDELSLGGDLPIPSGIDMELKLKSDTSKSAKCQLHVVFQTPDNDLKKLSELKKLHQNGILTDEEFSNAKAKIIESL